MREVSSVFIAAPHGLCPLSLWKKTYLSRNQPLVPKNLGTAILRHTEKSLCLISSAIIYVQYTKATSLLIIHGPKVSISKSISRGPSKVEIRVVNQGDC